MKLFHCLPLLSAIALVLSVSGAQAKTPSPPAEHQIKAADNKIFAQKLVNEELAAHPEVMLFAIHAVPPGSAIQQNIAYNKDTIGEADDPEEVEQLKHKMFTVVASMKDQVKRYQVKTPLTDSSGKVIGLLALSFYRKADGQEAAMLARQVKIAAELSKKIPNLEALFEPAGL